MNEFRFPPAPARFGANGSSNMYMSTVPGGFMQGYAVKFELSPASAGCWLLNCHGGLSWEDRDLLTACVHERLGATPQVVGLVMDLAQVEFVNSAGLGALFQLAQYLRGRGAGLVFVNVAPKLLRLFRTVGLDRPGRIAETAELAVEQLTAAHAAGTGVTPPP